MSSLLPSSPTRTFPPVNNSRDHLVETSLPRFGSNEVITQCTGLQDDSDSESSWKVAGPFDLRHTISKNSDRERSAGNDHSVFQPSPAEVPIPKRPEESFSWTKERLRSKPGQAIKAQQDHSAEDHNTIPETRKGTKRKTSASHEQSVVADRTSPGRFVVLVNQIGRTNTIPNIREIIQELKARPYQADTLDESLCSRTPLQIDTPPARIIQATPNLAREIEGSIFNEHLSRICHRMALANFYCAYRAAHAKPHVFLQEFDRFPFQYSHCFQSRLRTKRG